MKKVKCINIHEAWSILPFYGYGIPVIGNEYTVYGDKMCSCGEHSYCALIEFGPKKLYHSDYFVDVETETEKDEIKEPQYAPANF